MVDQLSPLGSHWMPGRFGAGGTAGVTLSEAGFGSIVQVAGWPRREAQVIEAIREATGLWLAGTANGGAVGEDFAAFGFGPGRYLASGNAEGLSEVLRNAIPPDAGTVTDLSHGRVAFRVEGERMEWVLSKLFALDFAASASPIGTGRATVHHDIGALIQRTGEARFDVYVFRSFARSFWHMLCRAAEETGYEAA